MHRLRPPLLRAGLWLLVAAAVIGILSLIFGIRPDCARRLREPMFLTGTAASILTGTLAALAAFMASLPDRSRLWLALPAPAAALWLCTIGYGCISNWVAIGPGSIQAGEAVRCFCTLLATGLPLTGILFWMLRHAAALRPRGVTFVASLSVAAFTASALTLFHQLDTSLMILLWNFGTAVVILGIDHAVARRVL
ncbi:hypothetical protein GCM10011611_10130 [Aliidongia dinghuensis]|uniref:DUF1109 domain-containing protein n=1 Tax=Aliidongia dinghuensis TaxID=1867774 RepID=A0A8J2YQ03_9PROT|nr:hypothetical protein GCM10011611_10130 [Aliidongia dinghuensis]